LLEAETQDLLWHYKSQRKASVRGRGGIGLKSGRKKKRGRREQRNETEERTKHKRGKNWKKNTGNTKKGGIIQRRRERQRSNTETSIGSAIAFVLTEKERPIIIQNTNSQQAGLFIIFLVPKAAEKAKENADKLTQKEDKGKQ
jgi:hypothetical protein